MATGLLNLISTSMNVSIFDCMVGGVHPLWMDHLTAYCMGRPLGNSNIVNDSERPTMYVFFNKDIVYFYVLRHVIN